MGAAIGLRDDFDAKELRRLARLSRDADQSRRLLSLAVICDGGRRRDAARTGGVGLQVLRDWVLRFNAAGPDGLIDRKAPGATSKLDDAQREALAARVDVGPGRSDRPFGPGRSDRPFVTTISLHIVVIGLQHLKQDLAPLIGKYVPAD